MRSIKHIKIYTFVLVLALFAALLWADRAGAGAALPYTEDFETAGHGFVQTNNLSVSFWNVGTPINAGPAFCHSGSQCAATVIDANYPYTSSTHYEGPEIDLPAVASGEEIHLRFWEWFNMGSNVGVIQLSVLEGGVWSAMIPIGARSYKYSPVWSVNDTDITAYAGKTVKITFTLGIGSSVTGPGWYIDHIEIKKALPPAFNNDFEGGWSSWSTTNGLWEVGAPTSGPLACHNGTQCAATVLDGDYVNTTSKLLSPTVTLPALATPDEEIHLTFWHWFVFGGSVDAGIIEVEDLSNPDVWIEVSSRQTRISGAWTMKDVDLRGPLVALVHDTHRRSQL